MEPKSKMVLMVLLVAGGLGLSSSQSGIQSGESKGPLEVKALRDFIKALKRGARQS